MDIVFYCYIIYMASKLCDKNMTYQECELNILRHNIDKIKKREGREMVMSDEIKKIIQIVEQFLRKKKLICYGGTAINNILPVEDQFYNKNIEIPDYDFFSPNALDDAKELADIYHKEGFKDIEAKAGVHHGTFKVFVNFIPVADITYLVPELYKPLHKDSIRINGIHYASPNYLRMAMYLELSRPKGDVSRWEKVLKRLTLLNKNYPLVGNKCKLIDIQREFESKMNKDEKEKIYHIVRNSFISQGLVFFGGMANRMYMKYLNKKHKLENIPDFDVLAEDPEVSATIVKERLQDEGIKKVSIHKRTGVGEIIAPHYEVRVGKETVAFIYQPLACHSYNIIHMKDRNVRIATIDTMLSFYLAFLYTNRPYYDSNRILCMAQYLFQVQEKNRLSQKGILRRFSMKCIGKQLTLQDVRNLKAEKFQELKNKRGTKEYEEWFLRYNPSEREKTKSSKKKTEKKSKKSKKNSKQKQEKKKTKKNKNQEKKKTKKMRLGFFSRLMNV